MLPDLDDFEALEECDPYPEDFEDFDADFDEDELEECEPYPEDFEDFEDLLPDLDDFDELEECDACQVRLIYWPVTTFNSSESSLMAVSPVFDSPISPRPTTSGNAEANTDKKMRMPQCNFIVVEIHFY